MNNPPRTLLLVEGADDEHVVKNLCGAHRLGKIDEIRPMGGYAKLIETLPVQVKAWEGIVGVMVDADEDLLSRWQSIRSKLAVIGLQLPQTPNPAGTIVQPPVDSELPRFGIWVMPNNQTTGILEDFLRLLIPASDRALSDYVESSVAGLPKPTKFSTLAAPKAKIHTWLAWQEEPGKPLGQAVTARYLDPHVPEALVFVDWWRRLYFSSVTPGADGEA